MNFYLYPYILLGIILVLIIAIGISLRTPSKIRILTVAILNLIMARYISLILFNFVGDIKYLYMLKSLYFLNLVVIPTMAALSIYILGRSSSVKFHYIFIMFIIFISIYALVNIKFPGIVGLNANDIYVLRFIDEMKIYGTYTGINLIVIIVSIFMMRKKVSDKFGLSLVILACIVTMGEIFFYMKGLLFFPECIIGDLAWILTYMYAINKIKK